MSLAYESPLTHPECPTSLLLPPLAHLPSPTKLSFPKLLGASSLLSPLVPGAGPPVTRVHPPLLTHCSLPLFLTALIKYIRPVFVSRSDQDSRRKTVEEIKRRAQSKGKWPQVSTTWNQGQSRWMSPGFLNWHLKFGA